MKKKLTLLFLIFLFPITFAFFEMNHQDGKPKFTDEELKFIRENKDTVFWTGYFPAERRFSKKMCEKIEEDTSLKLRIYDESWNNSLNMLKKGTLPVVMNMNKTEKREDYTYFTKSFMPIPCGIYSNFHNGVRSFEDIRGKVIGVEKEVALFESFTQDYPNLGYKLVTFDTFEDTRKAFANGEIDCFLSTKSYDHNVRGLHFFKIDSITKETNHIGVSKNYPILYSILNKEVSYLKEQNIDVIIFDILSFELEKSLVEFSQSEMDYLNEKETIVVGLPKEYFLYAYGEENSFEGAIPNIVEKMGFICDGNFVFLFDSLKNLRLRNDVDFYIDNNRTKDYASKSVFEDEIIVVSTSDKKIINEVYELAPYQVGVFGVPNITNYLLKEMPNINVTDYMDFGIATKAMENNGLDYIILPKLFFSSIVPPEFLEICGELESNENRFVSNDENCIDIINKCLSIIDTQKVLHNEMQQPRTKKRPYVYAFIMAIPLGLLIGGRRLYVYFFKVYYVDNNYGLYNLKYLQKKIKKQSGYLILLEMKNGDDIGYYYGEKIYTKYIQNFLHKVKEPLLETESIFYVDEGRYLILKEDTEDVLGFCKTIKKDVLLRNIRLNYDLDIAYIDYQDNNLDIALNRLKLGLHLAQERREIIYFDEKMQSFYKNKIARDENIKNMVNEGRIELRYEDIKDKNGNDIGKYVRGCIEGVSHTTFYHSINRLNLMTKLDKIIIKAVISGSNDDTENIFIDVNEQTLLADGFFDWIDSKLLNNNISLYFIVGFDVLDRNMDILEEKGNFNYVVKNFGNDLKVDCLVKYYDIMYLLVDYSLVDDLEMNEEVLDFIVDFASKNNKKIITTNHHFEKADYYIEGDMR